MKIHRFIGNFNLGGEEVVINEPSLVHQIIKVLRLKKGESLVLSDGRGGEVSGEIKKIGSNAIVVAVQKKTSKKKSVDASVSLYCASLKKENFEWVAQKATEIGITELIPISASRVVKQNINEERVKKIMKDPAEQSGRKTLPELVPSMSLAEAFSRSRQSEERWFLDMNGSQISESKNRGKSISLFIGPEGGWSQSEKEEAKKSGLSIISMGPLTFRAETAAIIASYLAVHSASKK